LSHRNSKGFRRYNLSKIARVPLPILIQHLTLKFQKEMANIKTKIDEWEVRDLEDNSALRIYVENCTELGNQSKPGIQVLYMGHYVTYEPLAVERWAYQAGKAGKCEYLLEDKSWMVHEDQYVKNWLIVGSPLKARVEVKTRSSKPKVREYELPFELEN
jgi:hypothetical protein